MASLRAELRAIRRRAAREHPVQFWFERTLTLTLIIGFSVCLGSDIAGGPAIDWGVRLLASGVGGAIGGVVLLLQTRAEEDDGADRTRFTDPGAGAP